MAYHLAQAGLTEKANAYLPKAEEGPRQDFRPSSAGGAMDEVAASLKGAGWRFPRRYPRSRRPCSPSLGTDGLTDHGECLFTRLAIGTRWNREY
jgi:hypothetical protein